MKTLITQKIYYLIWGVGLGCLVVGILDPKQALSYQLGAIDVEILLVAASGIVAGLLFLLGLGYYNVIKTKGSVHLGLTLLQVLLLLIFCCWVLLPSQTEPVYQQLGPEWAKVSHYSQDVMILFILVTFFYSLSLTVSLLRKNDSYA